jgi:PPOX class probable F420-dependent enzyme
MVGTMLRKGLDVMPIGQVPATYEDILRSTTLGHLATIGLDGRPQVNPVWFLWDGERVLLSVKANTVKYGNLRHDPRLAISFADPGNSMRYLEIRGEVIEFRLYRDLTFVNQLSQKYTGYDMNPAEHWEGALQAHGADRLVVGSIVGTESPESDQTPESGQA